MGSCCNTVDFNDITIFRGCSNVWNRTHAKWLFIRSNLTLDNIFERYQYFLLSKLHAIIVLMFVSSGIVDNFDSVIFI